jgi:hypothetical protein
MAAVLRDTALYAGAWVSKFPQDVRDAGGRMVIIPFHLIGQSPATIADTYNLCVLPEQAMCVDLFAITDGLATSVTMAFGDAGSAARYLAATSFATTGLSVRGLAVGGYGYRPPARTIVVAVNAGAAITVGKILKGFFGVLPPAS